MTTTTDRPTETDWTHAEAMDIAREAYQRLVDLLARLDAADWDRPTDCEGWSVRDLAGHLVGAMRSAASVRELVGQQLESARRAKRDGGLVVDAMTALQIERTADLTPAELVTEAQHLVDRSTTGRRRTPAPLRRWVTIPVDLGTGVERWPLGWFVDVILTRDAWLHRIDLCRAVNREPELTAAHDGRIVADVVEEWLRRHGRPVTLTLTGPAGGTFAAPGEDPEQIELDAVEFCRIVSGRSTGAGLLNHEVPF
jgi:uncharacterized protein (TIGR03083 family)